MVRVADDICYYKLSSVVISVRVPESGVCVFERPGFGFLPYRPGNLLSKLCDISLPWQVSHVFKDIRTCTWNPQVSFLRAMGINIFSAILVSMREIKVHVSLEFVRSTLI